MAIVVAYTLIPSGPNPEELTDAGIGIGIIIAIIIIVILVILVVVDLTCFFTKKAGLTATVLGKRDAKDKDKEAMLEDGKNARLVAHMIILLVFMPTSSF